MMDQETGMLPSAMRMVEEGDTRPEVKKLARLERQMLSAEAISEQAFSILWDQHGTGDDRDRDLVWRWRSAFFHIAAGLHTYPKRKWTPELMADGFDADRLEDPEP